MADQGKTEQPTQRRLEKARKDGQFPSAKEFVSALQFMVFLGLLGVGGAAWLAQFRITTRALFAMAFTRSVSVEDLTHLAWQIFWRHFLPLAMGGLAVALATLGFRLATTRLGWSFKRLAPDFKRLDPLSKLRELPRQNLPALGQAALLLPLFLWAVYTVARDKLDVTFEETGEHQLKNSARLSCTPFVGRRRASGYLWLFQTNLLLPS